MSLLLAGSTALAEEPAAPDLVRARLAPFFRSLSQAELEKPSEAQADLGRMIYFDQRLSADRSTSCNDCHDLKEYGVGGKSWDAYKEKHPETRDPTSVYHAAYLDYSYWDAAIKRGPEFSATNNPFIQAFTRTNEMALANTAVLDKRLNDIKGYAAAFTKAFPEEDSPVSAANAGRALYAYARGLVTPAPIDRFLDGDNDALTSEQLSGAMLFDKMDCAACHTGPFFGGQMVQKLGIAAPWPNQKDPGYALVSGKSEHKMFFRVAPLRNVAETGPYFHDGSARSLKRAIYTMSIVERGMRPAYEDLGPLAAFLESLSGELPEDYIQPPQLPE